jgi:hypothetical protein
VTCDQKHLASSTGSIAFASHLLRGRGRLCDTLVSRRDHCSADSCGSAGVSTWKGINSTPGSEAASRETPLPELTCSPGPLTDCESREHAQTDQHANFSEIAAGHAVA